MDLGYIREGLIIGPVSTGDIIVVVLPDLVCRQPAVLSPESQSL